MFISPACSFPCSIFFNSKFPESILTDREIWRRKYITPARLNILRLMGKKINYYPRQAITLYPHLTTSKKLYNVALSRKYGSHGNQEFQMSSDFSWKTWIMNRDFEEKTVCCGLGESFHLTKPIFFALVTILVVILVFNLTKGQAGTTCGASSQRIRPKIISS